MPEEAATVVPVSQIDTVDASDTASRLRIAVARLARLLRQQNVGSLGPTLDAALATIEREGPLTLGELAARASRSPRPASPASPPSSKTPATSCAATTATTAASAGWRSPPTVAEQVALNRSRRHAWLHGTAWTRCRPRTWTPSPARSPCWSGSAPRPARGWRRDGGGGAPRRSAAGHLPLMRVRNFRLFFGGQLISQVGNWLTLVAQTLLVLKLTDNGFAVGLLTACQFAPVLFLGAWAGLVADRSDKRKLLIDRADRSPCCSRSRWRRWPSAATRRWPPSTPWPWSAASPSAFDNPARRAFVVEMVPETTCQNAVSLNSALMTSSRIVGPALAGLLVATVGLRLVLPRSTASPTSPSSPALCADATPASCARRRPPPRAKGQVREGLALRPHACPTCGSRW